MADALDRLVRSAEQPARPFSAAVAVDRDAVRFAKPELIALAQVLRRDGRVRPRGVALARRLVTDGAGPLFAGGPDELMRATRAAFRALDVRESD
jgi:hypothetical protein